MNLFSKSSRQEAQLSRPTNNLQVKAFIKWLCSLFSTEWPGKNMIHRSDLHFVINRVKPMNPWVWESCNGRFVQWSVDFPQISKFSLIINCSWPESGDHWPQTGRGSTMEMLTMCSKVLGILWVLRYSDPNPVLIC